MEEFQETGYQGEELVYTRLLKQYSRVEWPNRSPVPTDWSIECKGETFHRRETTAPFDVWAADKKGAITFLKVKKVTQNFAEHHDMVSVLSPTEYACLLEIGKMRGLTCKVVVAENVMSQSLVLTIHTLFLSIEGCRLIVSGTSLR
jgi:hypothetical protein